MLLSLTGELAVVITHTKLCLNHLTRFRKHLVMLDWYVMFSYACHVTSYYVMFC